MLTNVNRNQAVRRAPRRDANPHILGPAVDTINEKKILPWNLFTSILTPHLPNNLQIHVTLPSDTSFFYFVFLLYLLSPAGKDSR